MKRVLEGLPLGFRQLGREACHSPPSGGEIKNESSYTSNPLQALYHAKGQLFTAFSSYMLHVPSILIILDCIIQPKLEERFDVSKFLRQENTTDSFDLVLTLPSLITGFINGHIYSIFLFVRTKTVSTKAVMCFWTWQKIKFFHILQYFTTR